MQASEEGLAVIHIIAALPQFEIHDIDTVNLTHTIVIVSEVDIFGDCFRHAIEHAVEIGQFAVVLYFDDRQFATVAFGQDVDAIELIVLRNLV